MATTIVTGECLLGARLVVRVTERLTPHSINQTLVANPPCLSVLSTCPASTAYSEAVV